ncbi:MAG: hypothetical protein JWO94_1683 [Verrucomicrobiaceae bacterium]|nr:hypothetical protein [Verrucomicrobiaceae bacterium]
MNPAPPPSRARISIAAWLLPLAAVTLLAGHMSGAIACLSEQGSISLKPRDFTLGLSLLSLALVFFNRPSFSPAVLSLLLIPILRLSDSAVLKRYVNVTDGDPNIAVMTLASVLLVTVVSLLVLSTENGPKIAVRAAIAIILIGVGSIAYEAAGLAQYSQINGRPAGFLTQPNEAIIMVCLMLGIVLTLSEAFWLNIAVIATAAVGVGITLSRSGMLVFSVMVTCYLAANLRRHFGKIVIIVAASIPAAIAGLAMLMQMASSRNFGTDKNATDRVSAITGMFSGNTDKMESQERMKDLHDGWEGVTDSPVFGHGTGSASSHWQPHNQWVGIWLDIGVGGVMLYAGTLLFLTVVCLKAGGRGLFALLPLWCFSVFSQNLVETAGYWFCAGVVALVATKARFRLALRRAPVLVPVTQGPAAQWPSPPRS